MDDKERVIYDEYEIDLREYVRLLWDHRSFILGLFIIAILAAGLISQFVLTPVYQTETTIYLPSFELIDGQELSRSDYLSLLYENELREKVIKEFKLKEDNSNFTIEDLQNKLVVEPDQDSQKVKIKLTDSDPVLAKNILSFWTNNFINRVKGFIEEQNQQYLTNLENLMKEREEKYLKMRSELSKFEQKNDLRLMKSRLNNKQNQLVGLEEKITNLKRDIQTKEARLKEVNKQLNTAEEFIITDTLLDQRSFKVLKNILPELDDSVVFSTQTENINQRYITLKDKKDDLEQWLASSKTELQNITRREEILAREIKELQVELTSLEEKAERLKQGVSTAKRNYLSSEKDYSQAQQKLSGKRYNLMVVNKPIVPQSPISPNKKLNVAIAGVLALMLAIFIVFFREFMKEEEIHS